jgi:hypothetical protein
MRHEKEKARFQRLRQRKEFILLPRSILVENMNRLLVVGVGV